MLRKRSGRRHYGALTLNGGRKNQVRENCFIFPDSLAEDRVLSESRSA